MKLITVAKISNSYLYNIKDKNIGIITIARLNSYIPDVIFAWTIQVTLKQLTECESDYLLRLKVQ